MRLNLQPASIEYPGTVTVGDQVTIQGVAVVASVTEETTPDPTGSRTQTVSSAVLMFEEGSPTGTPA